MESGRGFGDQYPVAGAEVAQAIETPVPALMAMVQSWVTQGTANLTEGQGGPISIT
jgi:hypothetical protein